MKTLRAHPGRMTALAFALAIAGVVGIAAAYGFGGFGHAWEHLNFRWLALSVAAAVLGFPAYAASYDGVSRVEEGTSLGLPLAARLVIAGFGPFAAGGGFALDKRALHAVKNDERDATVRVLGLGALEWALLAPAAWVSAVWLLAAGDHRPMSSLLWPWAIAVPIGFAIGLWLAAPARRSRVGGGSGPVRTGLRRGLEGVDMLRLLAGGGLRCWAAWLGMALYWTLEIASFYGAIRFVGLHLNLGELILAYATGYALTRRSLPLGGAGVTEVLLTFALHWVGQPVAPALAAVVSYRAFNFVLPTIPALIVRPRIRPLLDAVDTGHTPARPERGRAAVPLGRVRT